MLLTFQEFRLSFDVLFLYRLFVSQAYYSFLNYWRQSLADGSRLAPSQKAIQNGERVAQISLANGKIDRKIAKHAFENAAKEAPDQKTPKTLPVLVLPLIYAPRVEHGERRNRSDTCLAPLIISAAITQSGDLIRDADARQPALNRLLLEPTNHDTSIGTVEAADHFYSINNQEPASWNDTYTYAIRMLEQVTASAWNDLRIEGWEREAEGRLIFASNTPTATHILGLYDWLREERPAPLLEKVHNPRERSPLLTPKEQWSIGQIHTGHANPLHPLARSQRQAILHLLREYDHQSPVTVVNGPPGTGKTTFIQSLVASLWVKAAINEEKCPLIVAASTSNQAVTNVIAAFDSIQHSNDGILGRRWLSSATSFGVYFPSSKGPKKTSIQIYTSMPRQRELAEYFASAYEDPKGLAAAKNEFLNNFKQTGLSATPCHSVLEARKVLHQFLKAAYKDMTDAISMTGKLASESGAKISLDNFRQVGSVLQNRASEAEHAVSIVKAELVTLRDVERGWHDLQGNDPWWMTLLGFLEPIKARRSSRDKAFLLNHHATFSLLGIDNYTERQSINKALSEASTSLNTKLLEAERSYETAKSELTAITQDLLLLEEWCTAYGCSGEEEDLHRVLDTRIRYRLFQLATHYWEASYLLEVEKLLSADNDYKDGQAPEKLERHYRRIAMLAPCFISTLHMLPKWFRGYAGQEKYLIDTIDMLVIDEGGQVSPEVVAPALALAKRVCIVGDEHQIEPVWPVPEPLDRKTAATYLGFKDPKRYDDFARKGFLVANGSALVMAQQVARYDSHPHVAPGLFLTEHRRSLPEIISYCNELTYKGLLEPKRPHQTFKHGLPPIGWMHIASRSTAKGGSHANEDEASAIAEWIFEHKEILEDTYNQPLKNILAVVTPFNQQARCIKSVLNTWGLHSEELTVGTLHAMQGAERPIIIFSPTYGTGCSTSNFFSRTSRMLNVAVSRAKDSFLVIGNMDLFRRGPIASSLLGDYLFRHAENELSPLPSSRPPYTATLQLVRTSHPILIRDLTSHRAELADAFNSARSSLVIVSPFLTARALAADGIPSLIRAATRRGVQVAVVTDEQLNRNGKQFDQCVQALQSAGATVYKARDRGIHCKVLCVDDSRLVSGSFNWLGAVRDGGSYERFELSIALDGDLARNAIGEFILDMHDLAGLPLETYLTGDDLAIVN